MVNLIYPLNANAQLTTPSTATIIPVENNGDEARFVIKLQIDEGWYAYANNPGDTGLPFTVNIGGDSVKSFDVLWPESMPYTESIGDEKYVTNIYKNEASIPVEVKLESSNDPLQLKIKLSYGVCNNVCLPVNSEHEISIPQGFTDYALKKNFFETEGNHIPLALILIMAFLGGLILNLMPCVLPVLSIKLFSIIKYSGYKSEEIKANLLATSLGIIVSFIALAILNIILKSIGIQFGWGFHFQEPFFLIFLCVILLIFALNLWGDFEIILPGKIADKVQFESKNLHSSFYTGVFATLLATPCTAPFITTSVAFALSQGFMEILIIYIAMGLGMSAPYYIIAFNNKLISFIPKPGAWMNKLKKIFALMVFATLGWLLYVLSFQISAKSICILIGALVLVKFMLTGWKKITYKRVFLVALAIFIALVIPLLMNKKDVDHSTYVSQAWEKFDQEKINKYVNEGRIVFVDVTAEWCLICKTNKFFVLDQVDFINHLKANEVVLMRADFTNRSKEISDFLAKHNRFGIPFNLVISKKAPQGIILSELLTRKDVYDAIDKAK